MSGQIDEIVRLAAQHRLTIAPEAMNAAASGFVSPQHVYRDAIKRDDIRRILAALTT
jgi:hypothetical protein